MHGQGPLRQLNRQPWRASRTNGAQPKKPQFDPLPSRSGFVGFVDKARYVTNQELPATLEEGSYREAALSYILEGSEDESWKRDG